MVGTDIIEIGFPHLRYAVADGAIKAPLALDRVFADGTLDT